MALRALRTYYAVMPRSDQEIDIVEEITQILGDNLELNEVFQRAVSLLSRRLEISRAALVLLDRASGQLRTVAAVGLTPAEQQRARYAVGEGVTGRSTNRARRPSSPTSPGTRTF